MSSQLSVSTLAKLHSHVLKMIDGGVEEAKASIEALRANLKLSDIQTAPDPPLQDEQKLSEYLNVRELIVELFQTLFEVYCYATSVQMAPLRNHIRPYLQDIISEGIVPSTLLRIEQISIQHKSVQTNNQLTIPASRKKNLLSALIQERMALAALLHSIVSFSVPPQAQVNQLLNILSKLEQGDPLTIPLLMASLASLRVSSKNISATVFIGTPARLVADHRHQMLQEYPDDRHELTLSQLQEVHQSLKELTYSQPGMKDVVILALTISEFYLENNGIHIEDVSLHSSVKGAFTSNALPWLITHVLVNVDRPFDCLSLGLDILYRSIPREKTSITYYPLNDRLQEMTTIELQHLTVNIITRLSKLLTHLKTTADVRLEEDKRPLPTLTTSQMDQTVTHYHSTTIPSSSVRSDTEIFSLFITMLFERRPHACRIFWSDEPSVTAFFRFLQTITVSPHRRYQESSLHLVSSLINEPLAAAKAFQVVQNEMLGTITWVALFAGIDYYVKAFKKLAPQPIHNSVISSSEVDLLVSLLRLLRQVCTFDANVRRSILSLANNEVLPLIFDFLTCSIPLRLKAALMEAIASFVSHTSCHLLEHQHISQRIWMFMEIIVIIPQLSLATIGHQKGGLRQELETRESLLQHYPLTIAYLHLLHNLTPPHLAYDEESQASQQHQQQAIGGQLFALVNNLGSPNRPPGVQPYYEYMIQDIFLKAESRNYMNPKELWVQWKWVLSTILNCLIDLDMVSLESDLFITQQYASTNPSLSSYSTSTYSFYRLLSDHPAFFMLSDILEGKPLLDGILLVISKAREAFNESALRQEERATELKSATIVQGNEWPSTNMDSAFISSTDSSNRTITFSSPRDPNLIDPTTYHEYEDAVLFAFRVLHQVLLMQSKFLYEFLPAVAGHTESTTSSSASSKLYVSSKRELDHHLSSRKQAVVDIMFFIQSPNRSVFLDTIGILSIQILTGLSLSSSFIHSRSNINSLVAILSSSELAEPIKTSYSIRMTTSNGEKEPIALYKYDEVQVKSVRLAMLQLLVHNLKLKTIPTIAHMLLGLTKDVHLDLHAPSVASSSLFAEILKLLKGEEPLHILFEEQAQALIYFLLSQPLTFPLSAIMKSMGFFIFAAKRFLDPNRLCFAVPKEFLDTAPFLNVTNVPRHMENRNTLSTPSAGSFSTPRRVRIAPNPIMPPPTNPDLSQETTFAKQMCEKVIHVVALLCSWAWTMKYLAVQIKVSADQPTYLESLAGELFMDSDIPKLCIILDFIMVSCLDSAQDQVWNSDDIQNTIAQLELHLPSGWPTRVDDHGCHVYDLKACQQILLKNFPHISRNLSTVPPYSTSSATGAPARNTSNSIHAFTEQMTSIPKYKEPSPMVRSILDCFSYRNSQRRLFNAQLICLQAWLELLSVSLLTHLEMFGSTSTLKEVLKCLVIYVCKHLKSSPNEFRVHLSKAYLLLVSILNQVVSADSLDTLHLTEILRTNLEGIKAGDSSVIVRGNLYTSLLIYLNFITGLPVVMDLESSQFRISLRPSVASSLSSMKSNLKHHASSVTGFNKVESQALLMLRNQGGEKFLEILCTDATHFGIWQTVALTLLDVLFVWSLRESRHWVFDYILSKNVLRNFVSLIKAFAPALVQICHQTDLDSQSSSILFIYESLILLFTRMALNKYSCESLVATGVVSILADCSFLTYRMELLSNSYHGNSNTSSSFMSLNDNGNYNNRLTDPYAYFNPSSQVTLEMVSDTLYRFNQILIPTLDFLIAVTSAMSQATDKPHEYLMKSVNHFLTSHSSTFERILRSCLNLVQVRIPCDDEELELSLFRQVSQISCLLEFVARSKLPTSPILSELLLMLFLRFTRAEWQSNEKQQQVETWMLKTCSHVIGYSFALLSEGKFALEQGKWGSFAASTTLGPPQSSRIDTTMKATATESSLSSLNSGIRGQSVTSQTSSPLTRYVFDPDLAAAKDTYYSNTNRITLGLLILFMNQITRRLRSSLSLQETLNAKQFDNSPSLETLDEWTSMLFHVPSLFNYRIPFETLPKEKKVEVLRKQLYLKSKEVEQEVASYLRILEVTMCVLFLHLRHYTSISEELPASSSTSNARPFTMHDLGSEFRSSQRHSMNLNNLKIDATSVLPELEKSFKSLPLPENASSNLIFLEFLCQASLECINVYKSTPSNVY